MLLTNSPKLNSRGLLAIKCYGWTHSGWECFAHVFKDCFIHASVLQLFRLNFCEIWIFKVLNGEGCIPRGWNSSVPQFEIILKYNFTFKRVSQHNGTGLRYKIGALGFKFWLWYLPDDGPGASHFSFRSSVSSHIKQRDQTRWPLISLLAPNLFFIYFWEFYTHPFFIHFWEFYTQSSEFSKPPEVVYYPTLGHYTAINLYSTSGSSKYFYIYYILYLLLLCVWNTPVKLVRQIFSLLLPLSPQLMKTLTQSD